MQEIKERKPAGPKPKLVNRRMINVSLTDETIERAREIGAGNISQGVRMAVDGYHKDENK
jgi:hypothetical protein